LARLWRKIRESKSVEIVDFAPYTPKNNAETAFIGAPLLDENGKPVAVIALQFPHAPIQKIVGNREGMGKTGESYLIAADDDSEITVEFRSKLTTLGDGQYVLGADALHLPYIDEVMAGQSVRSLYPDSVGALVLVCASPLDIEGLRWGCFSKMDAEEAFVPTVEGEREDFLTKYVDVNGYEDAYLISPTGFCFYSVCKEADYETNLDNGEHSSSDFGGLVREVLQTRKFGFADFAPYAPDGDQPAAFIAEPILRNGNVEMVVALELSPKKINAIVQEGSSRERSLDSYLVGPDNIMRSDSLLSADHTVANAFATNLTVQSVAIEKALDGTEGAGLETDYRGEEVLAAYGPIEVFGTTYALMSQINSAVAFAAVRDMRNLSLIVGVLAIIAILVTAITMARSIANPLRAVIMGLTSGSEQVSSASGQLSSASQMLSESSSEQASSLEETSSSLEEMASQTKQTADNAGQAESAMKEARVVVAGGVEAMTRMSTAMNDIRKASEETSRIIKTIDDIAFQTNLLALNAAVEAARAGEAGKGFAVVAEEVRNLAQRSAEAARNTSELIERSQTSSENGVQVAEEVSGSLETIKESAATVKTLVDEIAAAAREQSQGIEQITTAVAEMDKAVQQNASTSEESASAAEELSSQAEELNGMIEELAGIIGGNAAAVGSRAGLGKKRGKGNGGRGIAPAAVAFTGADMPAGSDKHGGNGKDRYQPLAVGAHESGNGRKKLEDPEQIIPMDDDDFADF
jgi:methyl-accepting chemotaxis protein